MQLLPARRRFTARQLILDHGLLTIRRFNETSGGNFFPLYINITHIQSKLLNIYISLNIYWFGELGVSSAFLFFEEAMLQG